MAIVTVKEEIDNTLLSFPAASVTVIVQSVYLHSLREFSVIVLFHAVALTVAEEQDPE